jgi:hypothetical protein
MTSYDEGEVVVDPYRLGKVEVVERLSAPGTLTPFSRINPQLISAALMPEDAVSQRLLASCL